MKLQKYEKKPILSPNPANVWEEKCVLNPTVIYDEETERFVMLYRVGAVLMDLDDPRKIIARTKDFLMEPEHDYETCGIYEGCVFPTGTVVKDGILYVYYGTADTYIGLATADFEALLKYLIEECHE